MTVLYKHYLDYDSPTLYPQISEEVAAFPISSSLSIPSLGLHAFPSPPQLSPPHLSSPTQLGP